MKTLNFMQSSKMFLFSLCAIFRLKVGNKDLGRFVTFDIFLNAKRSHFVSQTLLGNSLVSI